MRDETNCTLKQDNTYTWRIKCSGLRDFLSIINYSPKWNVGGVLLKIQYAVTFEHHVDIINHSSESLLS